MSEFRPVAGGEAIKLPVSKGEFLRFLEKNSVEYRSIGAGSDSPLGVPVPSAKSGCQKTEEAIIATIHISSGAASLFTAYIHDDHVVCVDAEDFYTP